MHTLLGSRLGSPLPSKLGISTSRVEAQQLCYMACKLGLNSPTGLEDSLHSAPHNSQASIKNRVWP